ncbi:MAG: MBL fold metallo-hydrolase [Treponema sp.]|jgi:glyoxylase-like metal-dependent hydrolase (beta-lactamase superfamily II)|nr:MBL fold metallo-hydrolase [Treponema sp.]
MSQTTNSKKNIHCLCVGSNETNCWIYTLPDIRSCAVIDPGADAPVIIKHLRQLNLYPKYILLTHGHWDHITALPELLQDYVQKPESQGNSESPAVAIHRDDASYLKAKPDILLSDGDIIGPFRVIHVPGHTPGSVAFYDEGADVLFSGDTLFLGTRGTTDNEGGDHAKIIKSLELLLSMKKSIKVYPGHGHETTIAREAARGLQYFM